MPPVTPQVSVIVPFRDPGPDFRRCIESLLDQTLARAAYELLFVDKNAADELRAALLERVRSGQLADGGWPAHPLAWGWRGRRRLWYGSRAVTTALCVEALLPEPARYARAATRAGSAVLAGR